MSYGRDANKSVLKEMRDISKETDMNIVHYK